MSKLLIIGIDGGTWDVLTPAIKQGYMPCLESLLNKSCSGVLRSTVPAITPTAWSTFQTGVSPAANNIFSFSYLNRQTKQQHFSTTSTMQKTLWEILSDNGLKVSVVNLPMTYPPREINGYMVTGVNTPSEDSDFTWPKELKAEILEKFPNYRIFTLENMLRDFSGYYIEKITNQLTDIISQRLEVARFLLGKQEHDVFMLHFQANDILQHALWPLLDKTCKDFDEKWQKYIFEKFYAKLDDCIKELNQAFGKSARTENFKCLIASDHGFEHHEARFNLGSWLVESAYTKLPETKVSLKKKISKSLKVGKILKHFFKEQSVNNLEKKLKVRSEPIDSVRSSALAIGKGSEGFLYCFDMTDQQKQELRKRLLDIDLPNPERGKLFEKVLTADELYKTEIPEDFPDFFIIPKSGYTVTGKVKKDQPLFSDVLKQEDLHLGKHAPEGIFVLTGFEGSQRGQERSIYDIAPTVLEILGIELPDYLSGTPLTKKASENRSEENLLPKHNAETNEEDEEKIKQRLANLGYM
ncbi:phosphonoacetate hydrolase [Sedimentisphaera cyanobacteriorum]|uniref:Phosphonoacetate hydrolase n=1 Tax=Sedimentisphaera cyanobacteriorum TaxID=1940790 RepID=A0A1Q2HS58_9BACT|nr:alkaline phosphatase family protein [Sedimentisphaera cyanobacteriorum]AQQ10104.1 phosphonoacetate hydrolase [Sedimentisphaera cyanobacteriorum]